MMTHFSQFLRIVSDVDKCCLINHEYLYEKYFIELWEKFIENSLEEGEIDALIIFFASFYPFEVSQIKTVLTDVRPNIQRSTINNIISSATMFNMHYSSDTYEHISSEIEFEMIFLPVSPMTMRIMGLKNHIYTFDINIFNLESLKEVLFEHFSAMKESIADLTSNNFQTKHESNNKHRGKCQMTRDSKFLKVLSDLNQDLKNKSLNHFVVDLLMFYPIKYFLHKFIKEKNIIDYDDQGYLFKCANFSYNIIVV